MARFRLFGRTPDPAGAPPVTPPLPPFPASGWAAPAGAPTPWSPLGGGPATWAASPAAPLGPGNDPPTDPRGFPPLPEWSPTAPGTPDPAEAAALAGAFAVDYLSWDEEDPARRGRVLHDYLSVPGADPARIGWTGQGRQRADFALPGRVRPDGEGRVLVDVRVRVTPYRAVGEKGRREPDGGPAPAPVGVPAVAPAPTGRGWRSLPSCWVRLSVPVVLDGDRLAVDAWEETLGAEAPAPNPELVTGNDHTLADDDDPLTERPGGAW
jgi:hypothetical protein